MPGQSHSSASETQPHDAMMEIKDRQPVLRRIWLQRVSRVILDDIAVAIVLGGCLSMAELETSEGNKIDLALRDQPLILRASVMQIFVP